MNSARLKDLLNRYLNSESSVSENKRIENWYQKLGDQAPVQMDEIKEQKVKEEIWSVISPKLSNGKTAVRRLNSLWLQIAASLFIMGTVGLFAWQKNNDPENRIVTKNRVSGYTTLSTNIGERKLLKLPDGSLLTLNSGSAVRFRDDFSEKRNIEIIDGEVFFDVKHDTTRPFIVTSGVLKTQVLGTAFNIKAYTGLNKISVSVIRGKVGVTAAGKPVEFLLRGRQLLFDKNKGNISLSAFNEQEVSWQKGNLVLNNVSFEDMAILMNKNYGVHLVTPLPTIKSKHFTVTINTAMPYMKALEVIAAIHHLKIKERRGTIEIYQ